MASLKGHENYKLTLSLNSLNWSFRKPQQGFLSAGSHPGLDAFFPLRVKFWAVAALSRLFLQQT